MALRAYSPGSLIGYSPSEQLTANISYNRYGYLLVLVVKAKAIDSFLYLTYNSLTITPQSALLLHIKSCAKHPLQTAAQPRLC